MCGEGVKCELVIICNNAGFLFYPVREIAVPGCIHGGTGGRCVGCQVSACGSAPGRKRGGASAVDSSLVSGARPSKRGARRGGRKRASRPLASHVSSGEGPPGKPKIPKYIEICNLKELVLG